jgi:hypothetical protein
MAARTSGDRSAFLSAFDAATGEPVDGAARVSDEDVSATRRTPRRVGALGPLSAWRRQDRPGARQAGSSLACSLNIGHIGKLLYEVTSGRVALVTGSFLRSVRRGRLPLQTAGGRLSLERRRRCELHGRTDPRGRRHRRPRRTPPVRPPRSRLQILLGPAPRSRRTPRLALRPLLPSPPLRHPLADQSGPLCSRSCAGHALSAPFPRSASPRAAPAGEPAAACP